MDILFFDDVQTSELYPLTSTISACDIRIGILTVKEKWLKRIQHDRAGYITREPLNSLYRDLPESSDSLFLNSRFCPNDEATEKIENLKSGEALTVNNTIAAARGARNDFEKLLADPKKKTDSGSLNMTELKVPADVFVQNNKELRLDFELVTHNRTSADVDASNTVIGDDLFVEKGAKITASIINTASGPVYIGKNAEVMEGCLIRGGLALCENSVLKLGTKIYGACTFGVYAKIGGEINNSVVFDYSNKGHDGFLGNSVISSWCNLGAGTNNSNLKNNYGSVKVWNHNQKKFTDSGRQFYGLVMGAHSKCSINSMFNTGTVAGTACNIYGHGFPDKYIPDFTWGGIDKSTVFELNKMFETADRMMKRRGKSLTEADKTVLKSIFDRRFDPHNS